jgi:hypothetical protein
MISHRCCKYFYRLTSRLRDTVFACLLAVAMLAFTGIRDARALTLETTTPAPTNVTGLWWNANESGWGLTLTHQANLVFVAMYTYDGAGAQRWYTSSNCIVSGDGCSGDLYAATGGSAPTSPWNPSLTLTKVGVFTAKFSDLNTGTISYSINGANGTKSITRFTWGTQTPPASPIAWSLAPELNAGMPAGVAVYRGNGLGADALRAIYATFDPAANPNVEWNVVSVAPGAKTPLEFAQGEPKRTFVVINGGYFGASTINQSFSLIIKNGALAAPGAKQLTRNGQTYFPTRAAFGEMPGGEIVATWAYPVGAGNAVTRYTLPSPNDSSKAPLAVPDANFPAGATAWNPTKAIGGGPMLIKNGNKFITATEEIFDAGSGINAGGNAPRTAVARLVDGKVLFIVVDGRSAASRGVTLSELADVLLNLGATDAVNLDGGGSSAMVVNGAVVNVPSDGAQRAVPSVLMIKEK